MTSPQIFLDPKHSPANATTSHGPVDVFSRSMRSEITRLAIIALFIFAAGIMLDVGNWLDPILEYQRYHIDDIIISFFAVGIVLMVFLLRGWREVRLEARERAAAVKQMEVRSAIEIQISQMTSLLHACFELEEARSIISHYAQQLFPNHTGALYVFRSSRNLLEVTATWGEEGLYDSMFEPQQCWALRQGQKYEVSDAQRSIFCPHVHQARPYTCLPMMAHGEVLALLHVFSNRGDTNHETLPEEHHALLRVFTQNIALALSNLKLRDTLRQQSIRDPLTGLFNRRYLEETLSMEIERAKRNNVAFSIMMLDLDHFKRFNDTHGHEAGDAVLQALGRFLQRHVRGGDMACRYGGEEFTLILPGMSMEAARQRAEQLCDGIRTLNVDFKNQILGPLTLSVGIATFPDHGESRQIVLEAADRALYQAKSDGRDRVVVAP